MKLIAACIVLASLSIPADAAERVEVCAKQGRGQAYKVEATYIDGSELNAKTNSLRFTSFSKYVVIFWAEGQATIIEMDFSFPLNAIGTNGKDQEGRKWEVSTSSLCF